MQGYQGSQYLGNKLAAVDFEGAYLELLFKEGVIPDFYIDPARNKYYFHSHRSASRRRWFEFGFCHTIDSVKRMLQEFPA